MMWWVGAGCALVGIMVGAATFFLDMVGLVGVGIGLLLCCAIGWAVLPERAGIEWALFAASFAMLPFADLRLPMGGLSVPVSAFFAVLAMGMTFARFVVTRDWRLEDHGILFSLVLVLLGNVFSLAVAGYPEGGAPDLVKWLFHSLLFICLMSFRNRVWHLRTVVTLILVTGALSAYGLFEHSVRGSYDLNFYTGVASRSATGQHLALVLPFALSVAMIRQLSWPVRLLIWVSTGASLAALALTYSRNGWLAVATALMIMTLSTRRIGIKGIVTLSVVALGFLYLGYLAPEGIQDRFWSTFSVQESRHSAVTNAGRIRLQAEALKVILEHPIAGVGLGNYANAIPWYLFSEGVVGTPPHAAYPHDFYLLVWAEGGVFAFAGFIGMLYFVTKRVLRGLRESAGPIGPDLLRGALGSLVSLFMVLFLADEFNTILMWAVLGLAVSGAHAWAVHGSENVANENARYVKSAPLARKSFGVAAPSSLQRTRSTS